VIDRDRIAAQRVRDLTRKNPQRGGEEEKDRTLFIANMGKMMFRR